MSKKIKDGILLNILTEMNTVSTEEDLCYLRSKFVAVMNDNVKDETGDDDG